jgi:hypothetical protein
MNFQGLVLIFPLNPHHGAVFCIFDVIGLYPGHRETQYSSEMRTGQTPAICVFRPLPTALALNAFYYLGHVVKSNS